MSEPGVACQKHRPRAPSQSRISRGQRVGRWRHALCRYRRSHSTCVGRSRLEPVPYCSTLARSRTGAAVPPQRISVPYTASRSSIPDIRSEKLHRKAVEMIPQSDGSLEAVMTRMHIPEIPWEDYSTIAETLYLDPRGCEPAWYEHFTRARAGEILRVEPESDARPESQTRDYRRRACLLCDPTTDLKGSNANARLWGGA
eukprot:1902318-Rhodomonas_salina.3